MKHIAIFRLIQWFTNVCCSKINDLFCHYFFWIFFSCCWYKRIFGMNFSKQYLNCLYFRRIQINPHLNFFGSLMHLVNSSNYIVKYRISYFFRVTNILWLILEYCASGSIIDLMLAMNRTYTEIEIATIIKIVLKGLIIIHEKNLIYRAVKGANILLSGSSTKSS